MNLEVIMKLDKETLTHLFSILAVLGMLTILIVLISPSAEAAVEVGVVHQQMELDDDFNFEDKGLSGVSLGFAGEDLTTRFSYKGGDLYNGSFNTYSQMLSADLEYDFTSGAIQPYIVGGLGHFNTDVDDAHISRTFGTAGLGLKIAAGNLGLNLDVRGLLFDVDAEDSIVANIGITYALNSKPSPKPMFVPTPEPKPEVQKEIKTLVVLFSHDSDTLTPAQKDAIVEFTETLSDVSTVISVGQASSPGSDEYNLDLSERRAINVAEFIYDLGLDLDIKIKAFGEIHATGNEIQDRKVTVVAQ